MVPAGNRGLRGAAGLSPVRPGDPRRTASDSGAGVLMVGRGVGCEPMTTRVVTRTAG
ncbi:hypothetical protein HNR23_000999 [Nocardiopsis mwathae]|uniref:Uncharacterized protein n=1 Tax=Nocardiopsis mwathae TaxID=1472723 RepID=A0A7W9YF57_9ACTN|nr:hypothetical protein [Nocardiopsis mwathae]